MFSKYDKCDIKHKQLCRNDITNENITKKILEAGEAADVREQQNTEHTKKKMYTSCRNLERQMFEVRETALQPKIKQTKDIVSENSDILVRSRVDIHHTFYDFSVQFYSFSFFCEQYGNDSLRVFLLHSFVIFFVIRNNIVFSRFN